MAIFSISLAGYAICGILVSLIYTLYHDTHNSWEIKRYSYSEVWVYCLMCAAIWPIVVIGWSLAGVYLFLRNIW